MEFFISLLGLGILKHLRADATCPSRFRIRSSLSVFSGFCGVFPSVRLFLGICVACILLVVVAFVIVGPELGGALGRSLAGFSKPQKGESVRVHDVRPLPLIETVSAPGEISPFVRVNISAEVSARILDLPFREGDRVEQGDVVVRLDDRQFRAALQSAQAQRDAERFRLQAERSRLAGPRASLENARAVLARQRALYESGDVSKQTLEDAEARVRDLEATVTAGEHAISVIESNLAAAEAEIDRAKEALQRTTIVSPIAGKITALNAEVGELVVVGTMNNPGTVILTIGDLSRMKLDAKVNEADIARVQPGQRAVIRINAYRDEVFTGRVAKVPLQRTVDRDGTGYFKVEIEVDAEDGRQILSGLAANVDIEIDAHTGLTLPSQAVLDRRTDELPDEVSRANPLVDRARRTTPVVLRMVDGKAFVTPVRIGPSSLTDTMIVAGLTEGDVVVVGPFKSLEKLKHGERIEREGDPEPAAPAEAAVAARPSGGDGKR
jgi:HlyD family secretion protein